MKLFERTIGGALVLFKCRIFCIFLNSLFGFKFSNKKTGDLLEDGLFIRFMWFTIIGNK